jgi:adenylate kinase
MGPPGAGKGTQAARVVAAFGYTQFSTGDAFRSMAREDSDLGRRVKDIIDNGYLAPPEMAAEVVIAAVKKLLPASKGLVFDGTPRTLVEAKMVDAYFAQAGVGKPFVIYIKVEREDMEQRNSQRRYCLGISGDFAVVTPEDEKMCAEKGGHIGRRPDDEPEKFATRWNQFMELTYPVIEYYQEQGLIHEINGRQSMDEVAADIQALLA